MCTVVKQSQFGIDSDVLCKEAPNKLLKNKEVSRACQVCQLSRDCDVIYIIQESYGLVTLATELTDDPGRGPPGDPGEGGWMGHGTVVKAMRQERLPTDH